MKRLLIVILLSSLMVACNQQTSAPEVAESTSPSLPEGITLVEEYDGEGAEIAIPYTKYKLANGLTVVLHEDHSDPLVHVDVTYHVGSNREEVGRSGFAHFFEHMMFQGSANVADEEHFKTVSNAGGSLNGTTNSDRTNYFETVPANQLETALWLEADRMGLLLEAVTQEKFENQRETVKNERGQRVDNQPYGRAGEYLMKNLYPEGHPYSWPTIGWIEDLNRADLNDLKRFFLRWYGPNNAVLTIGGAIDPADTLEMVNKYFGPIPAGPEVENLPKQPATLDADRYISMEDNIHLPAIGLIIPTVYATHADEAPLDVAAKVLGQGQSSLLYQRLVQSGRAVQAFVNHTCRELACEMMFIVIQNPGSGETLAEMETAIRDTITEFAERGVTEDDLQKFKANYESNRVFGLQSVSGKVSSLAAFETFRGTPGGIQEDIERYLNVELDDVTRVFNEYIASKPAVILSIVPNGALQLVAREQNYSAPDVEIPENLGEGDSELALRLVTDNFDRSQKPTPGLNPTVDLPEVWEATLANGVRVLGVPNTETPTTTIQATFEVGERDEPAGKAGLASLTSSLMNEATTDRTAAEFTDAMERLGATVGVGSASYETSITLSTLSKNFEEAIPLMMERLLKPDFNEADFNRVKSQVLESQQQARKTPAALAGRALNAVIYGPDHVLSYPNSGLPSTVSAITLDDVKDFYASHIPNRLTGVLVSSNLSKDEVIKGLEGLGTLEAKPAERAEIAAPAEIKGRNLYLVDKPGAAQSSLRVAHQAMPYDALGDYYRAGLMNFALGGNFNSRINLNLREDKGYTYGARSGFIGSKEFGHFRFSTEVNKDSTVASIKEILTEMEDYAENGMTQEEFEFMRNAIGQNDALQYETPGRKLGLLSQVLRYDLPTNYRKRQQSILSEIEPETLNALAGELLHPEDVAIVVVGDAEALQAELEGLEIPITKLDEDGYPAGE